MKLQSELVYKPKFVWSEYVAQAKTLLEDKYAVGIIGGMGQAATRDLLSEVLMANEEVCDIKQDSDYLSVHISGITQTPDRTGYIISSLDDSLGKNEDPFPYLVQAYLNLKNMHPVIKYAGIACNTAHFFLPALQKFINEDKGDIQIINTVEESAKMIRQSDLKKVGLLATTGTLQTQLYHQALSKYGVEVVELDYVLQEYLVMDAIYGKYSGFGIKMGYLSQPKKKLQKAVSLLAIKGAQGIVAGCTEIPLAFSQADISIPFINPTQILARVLVDKTLNITNKRKDKIADTLHRQNSAGQISTLKF